MDIKATVTEADQAFTELLDVLASIPAEEINTIPFEGSWTAGQDAQHIILSAGGVTQIMNSPVADTDRDFEQNVASIRGMFLNFDLKFKSAENIRPDDKEYDKQELISTLQQIKADYLNAIETLDPTKTCLALQFPGVGALTRAEVMALTNTHTIRHVHQLKNIRQKLSN